MKPNVWKVVLESASLADIAEILDAIADELGARAHWQLTSAARNAAYDVRHYADDAPPSPSAPSVTDELPATGSQGHGLHDPERKAP